MNYSYLVIFILAIICVAVVPPSTALDTAVDHEAAQISVQNVTIDPQVLMQDDTGNVIIQIRNTGNQSVAIRRAELSSDSLTILNDQTYDSVGTLGPGNSMTFTFTVKANCKDGTYYLKFYLDFMGSGSLRFYIPVIVESSELEVSVIDSPDMYTRDRKDAIHLTIGNPRDDEIDGVILTPRGTGIRPTQSSVFIGRLDPNGQKNVTLDITPQYETNLTVDASYKNGNNKHLVSLNVPVDTGLRKIRAEPVVSNLEVIRSSGYYTLKGDITNNGLEFAHSIVLSVGEPASSIDPNPTYVVGNLEPDDSSSFKISLTCPGSDSFPLTIRYKDIEGNDCSETTRINLAHPGLNDQTGSHDSLQLNPGQSYAKDGSGLPGGDQGVMGVIAGLVVILLVAVVLALKCGFIQRISGLKRK